MTLGERRRFSKFTKEEVLALIGILSNYANPNKNNPDTLDCILAELLEEARFQEKKQ